MTNPPPDSPLSTSSTAATAVGQNAPAAAQAARTGAAAAAASPRTAGVHAWTWRGRRLRAIAAFSLGLLALACWRWLSAPAVLNEDLSVTPAALLAAGEKVNPNTASWASLARLPGLGAAHAKAIVAYRQAYAAAHDGRAAFTSPADLDKVPGIGPKTIDDITPYLDLPTGAPASPASQRNS